MALGSLSRCASLAYSRLAQQQAQQALAQALSPGAELSGDKFPAQPGYRVLAPINVYNPPALSSYLLALFHTTPASPPAALKIHSFSRQKGGIRFRHLNMVADQIKIRRANYYKGLGQKANYYFFAGRVRQELAARAARIYPVSEVIAQQIHLYDFEPQDDNLVITPCLDQAAGRRRFLGKIHSEAWYAYHYLLLTVLELERWAWIVHMPPQIVYPEQKFPPEYLPRIQQLTRDLERCSAEYPDDFFAAWESQFRNDYNDWRSRQLPEISPMKNFD